MAGRDLGVPHLKNMRKAAEKIQRAYRVALKKKVHIVFLCYDLGILFLLKLYYLHVSNSRVIC